MEKIDKKAVLDCIQNNAYLFSKVHQIKLLKEAINALPTSDGWISVEDRLPDHWQEVNVCLSGNVVRVATCIANEVYKGFYSDISTRLSFATVVKWQPLPTPPTK